MKTRGVVITQAWIVDRRTCGGRLVCDQQWASNRERVAVMNEILGVQGGARMMLLSAPHHPALAGIAHDCPSRTKILGLCLIFKYVIVQTRYDPVPRREEESLISFIDDTDVVSTRYDRAAHCSNPCPLILQFMIRRSTPSNLLHLTHEKNLRHESTQQTPCLHPHNRIRLHHHDRHLLRRQSPNRTRLQKGLSVLPFTLHLNILTNSLF